MNLSQFHTEAARKLQEAADSLKKSAATMRKCANEMESNSCNQRTR